jgi:hypothetical protein
MSHLPLVPFLRPRPTSSACPHHHLHQLVYENMGRSPQKILYVVLESVDSLGFYLQS